jgi:hypothetical protein
VKPDGQAVGAVLLGVALVLGLAGAWLTPWSDWWPANVPAASRASVPPPAEPAPAQPAPTLPGRRPAPLQVGVVPRPSSTVLPSATLSCTEAQQRHASVERLADVLSHMNGDLTAYAQNYARGMLAQPGPGCGLPPLDRAQHRRALERVRAAGVLDAAVLRQIEEVIDG